MRICSRLGHKGPLQAVGERGDASAGGYRGGREQIRIITVSFRSTLAARDRTPADGRVRSDAGVQGRTGIVHRGVDVGR